MKHRRSCLNDGTTTIQDKQKNFKFFCFVFKTSFYFIKVLRQQGVIHKELFSSKITK